MEASKYNADIEACKLQEEHMIAQELQLPNLVDVKKKEEEFNAMSRFSENLAAEQEETLHSDKDIEMELKELDAES
jgi:hypothetical protein